MAYKDAHSKASTKYNKEKCKFCSVKLHTDIDTDIITKLESVDSKQAYIKALIRKDIENGK